MTDAVDTSACAIDAECKSLADSFGLGALTAVQMLRALLAERDAERRLSAQLKREVDANIARAAKAEAERDAAQAEVRDLRIAVIAFAGPWAAQWATEWGLPDGHLHPEHYDLLARCGARMDSFTRAALAKEARDDQ